jgi:hypothetical protein
LVAACGGGSNQSVAPAPSAPPADAALQKVVLAADPGPALAVTAAKAKGAAEQVVVTGRVASVVKGFAVFTLMDEALEYCGQVNKEDGCKTPWDYCCDTQQKRTEHSLLVEFRDAKGQPIGTPSLPDTRLLDLLKVRGKLQNDDNGNLVLVADGMFRVQRPELPADVNWPK